MNIKIIRKLDMLQRLLHFFAKYPPTAPRAVQAVVEVAAAVAEVKRAAAMQLGGRAHQAGNVQAREAAASELRGMLRILNDMARILDRESHDLSPLFRLPRTRSYPALERVATVCIKVVEERESDFLEIGMTPAFLAELRAHLAAFHEATRQKISGRISQVGGTSSMEFHADRGLAAAQLLDACMRSVYRRDPAMLATWKHARHIERSASGKASDGPVVTEEVPAGPVAPGLPSLDGSFPGSESPNPTP